MNENRKNEISVQEDYLVWKGWPGKFGKLTKSEKAYFEKEISRSKASLPSGSQILEIGFGNGKFLTFAQQKQWNVYGTEISDPLVKIAKEYNHNVFLVKDLSLFDNNMFDLIVAFDVLEHISQENLEEFISQVNRVLKKEGVFIARFPNGDSPLGLPFQNGDFTHLTAIGSGKIKFIATKINMEIIFIGGAAEPILGSSLLMSIHKSITLPIKFFINFVINMIFSPFSNIAYCSSNLVIMLKK